MVVSLFLTKTFKKKKKICFGLTELNFAEFIPLKSSASYSNTFSNGRTKPVLNSSVKL